MKTQRAHAVVVSTWLCLALAACGQSSHDSDDAGSGGDSAADSPSAAEGCDPTRTTTTYRATATGSVAVESTGGQRAVPCLTLTGHGANEPAVGIASDGTVYFSPASTADGNGIVSSSDNGATWELSIPKLPNDQRHPKLQPFFYLEPETDRLFFATSKLVLNGLASFKDDPGIHLSVSNDGGKSWRYQNLAPEGRDWQKIFAGPPVTSETGAEPHVLYFSVPSPIAGNWGGLYPPPDFQHFYKSLDGGESWNEVSQLPIAPAALEGCAAKDYAMFGQGSVAADGTIFLGFRRCQELAVNVSEDEGETWHTRTVPGAVLPPYDTSSLAGILAIVGGENAITGEPITADADGNLYAVWADPDDILHYSTSKDRGKTWTTPVQVMAPKVQSARMVAITAKQPGTVAIAYFGTTNNTEFHGYIAESRDALAKEPTFETTTVNDPSEPLYPRGWQSGYDTSYFGNGGDEITLIQVKYAPSGDIWAAFVKDMCPEGKLDACAWDYEAHAKSRFQGAVGRLMHARD